MKKLKIVQVVGDSTMTGAPRHVILLSTQLLRRGHHVLVVAPPGRIISELKTRGIEVSSVRMKSPLDRRADHKIRNIIQNYKPDIVHCHGTKGGWLGRLATRKLPKIAVVYTEHLWTSDYHLANPVWEKFQLKGLNFMDKFTDATIAVSATVKNFLVKERIIPTRKITIVPNMLDPSFATVKRYLKPSALPVLIGTVGSLNIQKGFVSLVEALAIVRKSDKKLNWRCQIVGSGPLEKPIKRLVKHRKLSNFISLLQNEGDICETMRHFSIYVQNSRSESFGMATLEAMALAIPVIVSNRGALPELVRNGENGIVIPYGKESKIAEKLIYLINHEHVRNNLGEKARRSVFSKYNPTAITKRIELVYAKALANRRFNTKI